MRKAFFLLILLSLSVTVLAQLRVNRYEMPIIKTAEKLVVLNMPFGRHEVLNIVGDSTGLHKAGELMVDLVFTDYPSYASLAALNERRVNEFLKIFPFLRRNQIKRITMIRQMDGWEKEQAQKMFHGMVVRYREKQNKETMKKDLGMLTKILTPVIPSARRPDGQMLTIPQNESVGGDNVEGNVAETTIKRHKLFEPRELSVSKDRLGSGTKIRRTSQKFIAGITSEAVWDFKKRNKEFEIADSMAVLNPTVAYRKGILDSMNYINFRKYPVVTIYFRTDTTYSSPDWSDGPFVRDTPDVAKPHYEVPDSTVFTVFKRNKWKRAPVVVDVTASMYPYTGQLLLWLKLQSLDSFTTKYVFFNDGDDKPDDKKIIGKTGGVYSKTCRSFEEVKELVQSTMMKGGGGDAPENNVEALLIAEQEFPETDFTILIADNWAPVKDLALVNRLKKPVRIVLCGVFNDNIRVDYLNLARKTRGSIHLMGEDLLKLASLHEGEMISIGSRLFQIRNGEFRDLTETEEKKL